MTRKKPNLHAIPGGKSGLPVAKPEEGLQALSSMQGVVVYVNRHIPPKTMVVSPDLLEVIRTTIPDVSVQQEGQ